MVASSVNEYFQAIIGSIINSEIVGYHHCYESRQKEGSIVLPIGQLIVGMPSLKKLSTPDLILFSVIRSGIWIWRNFWRGCHKRLIHVLAFPFDILIQINLITYDISFHLLIFLYRNCTIVIKLIESNKKSRSPIDVSQMMHQGANVWDPLHPELSMFHVFEPIMDHRHSPSPALEHGMLFLLIFVSGYPQEMCSRRILKHSCSMKPTGHNLELENYWENYVNTLWNLQIRIKIFAYYFHPM